MQKRILVRCAIGFLFGTALMYLVPPLINRSPISSVMYNDELLVRVGSPTAAAVLTLLVMGLFGALCVGGTLFYEIDRWPLALATAAHYLAMSLGYLIPNWVLSWKLPWKLFLLIEGYMALGFFLIWLVMYLHYRAQVRVLNELAEKRNGKKPRAGEDKL